MCNFAFCFIALDNLGFGAYKEQAQEVLMVAKAVAAKKRKSSTKLENLGIPEEELLRQQQELFAKVLVVVDTNIILLVVCISSKMIILIDPN